MTAQGNSWDPQVIYNCTWCGIGKLCKTCHRHGNERGKCPDCPAEKKPDDGPGSK